MSEWKIDEEQLYTVNSMIQRVDHVLLRNLMTRTAQESALFPLMPYIDLSFNEAYYRYPDILRETMKYVTPEQVAHRTREVSTSFTRMRAFSTLDFYLLGRINLIRLGLLCPEDNLEDLWLVCNWWQRYMNAFSREYAHAYAMDASDIAPHHPERVLQVFEADAFSCDADEALRQSAAKFLATATTYNFLAHCECRLGQQGAGPYNLGGDRLMHIRDFTNMADGDFSWLDGMAEDIPYQNLSVCLITSGVAVDVTDFGSTYTVPEDYQSKVVGVGLYTSDFLSERYEPVGMGSAKELRETFDNLVEVLNEAIRKVYKRVVAMSARQRIDAGMFVYTQLPVGVTQIAGTYRYSDWEFVDERNERLRGLFNEEFAMDAYLENYAALLGKQGSATEYYLHPEYYNLWRKGGRTAGSPLPHPGREAILVSSSVLKDHDYSRRVNERGLDSCNGESSLPAKSGRYLTSRGLLTEDELNQAARAFRPKTEQDPWVHMDDQWVKYHWQTAEADELYRHTQQSSRLLRDRGASLRRADLDQIRQDAGETLWGAVGQ